MSILTIGSLLEETFRYWSTVTRVSFDDLRDSEPHPQIVHSGQPREKFRDYMSHYLTDELDGSDFCREQLLKSLSTASKTIILNFLEDYILQPQYSGVMTLNTRK